ncbi:MAG TPA: VIT1/CCC1 transporter family protein [Bacteroidia bacterium]|jgi:VIT1/CCC1 family predicted Fe2+/Mn2+ transporter|nr:VIT1/CCC1 transporter family protein [Bacteroidia bacterium]
MHQEGHFKQPAFIRDVIIGLSDGITVPFALTAGISGAVMSNGIIITAGIAEICAGSIAMGLGGFLSAKTEEEHYYSELAREYREVKDCYEHEKQEVRDVFANYGLSKQTQDIIADEMAKDEKKWVDFMMRYELGLEEPDALRARKSAMNIAISYIVGGIIPLLGYIFTANPTNGLRDSSIFTILCLIIFGYLKSKFTGQKPLAGALKTTAIGIVAAGAAFGIAWLFNNHH